MSKTPLAGCYSLYKAGTQKITRWLSEQAQQCNTSRKSRRKPHATNTTRDLVQCASIVARASNVQIPAATLELLADVISGRQLCAEWYASQETKDTETSRTHRYFIEVLSSIYGILYAAHREQQRDAAKPEFQFAFHIAAQGQRTSMAKDSVTNLFSHLELEEPAENPLETNARHKGPCPKKGSGDASAEHSLDLGEREDKEFALWCFLQDMIGVRNYIEGIWAECLRGELSFFMASATADTAFGILRRAKNDLFAAHSEFADLPGMLDFLGLHLGMKGREACIITKESMFSLPTDSPLLDLLCPAAILALTIFRAFFERCSCDLAGSITPESSCLDDVYESYTQAFQLLAEVSNDDGQDGGTATTTTNSNQSQPSEIFFGFHPFIASLLKLLHEVRCCSQDDLPEGICFYGEFLEAFRQLRPWLLVALQIYMDIYDAIGGKMDDGVRELSKGVSRTEAIFNDFETFRRRGACAATNGIIIGQIPQVFKADLERDKTLTERSLLGETDKIGYNSMGVRVSVAGRTIWFPADIWKTLPLTAADRIHPFMWRMHRLGIDILNCGKIVTAASHLYKAVVHLGLLQADWKDMDWFIKVHSRQRALVLSVPKNADPMLLARHYALAFGLSINAVLHPGQPGSHRAPKNERKYDFCTFVRTIADRISTDKRLGFLRGEPLDVVMRLIHEGRANAAQAANGRKRQTEASDATRTRVAGLQLLQTYKTTIVADEPEMNFDYLGFAAACAELLRTMRTLLLPKVRQIQARLTTDFESQFLGFLLIHAAQTHDVKLPLESSPLADAAGILQESIQDSGDKYTQAAYSHSCSKAPETQLYNAASSPNETHPGGNTSHGRGAGPEDPEDREGQAMLAEAETMQPTVSEVFAARRKKKGRRLLRTRWWAWFGVMSHCSLESQLSRST